MIRLSILTAGSIAGEKEVRTWPVILMTPLEDKEIIRGKIVAAVRRNIPLLILYPVLFCAIVITANVSAGRFRIREIFVSINLILFNLLNSMLLVTGCGSYFGVRLKNATEAVAATIISYMILIFLFSRVSIEVIISGRGIWISLVRQVVEKMIIGVIGVLLAWCAVRRLRRDVF